MKVSMGQTLDFDIRICALGYRLIYNYHEIVIDRLSAKKKVKFATLVQTNI